MISKRALAGQGSAWLVAARARRRRVAPPTARLLILALALAVVGCAVLAGCAALGAALHTSLALPGAGYQNANVNVSTGSGLPAGGVVTVTYSSGPAGNGQRDAAGPAPRAAPWAHFSPRPFG